MKIDTILLMDLLPTNFIMIKIKKKNFNIHFTIELLTKTSVNNKYL